jgi:hypothetical protein
MRRSVLIVLSAALMVMVFASAAQATIHPIVESFDCANAEAFANHPLGDPADPPGQTPGVQPENAQGNNVLRALDVITDGFNDLSSPALFGHKLDGSCGPAD